MVPYAALVGVGAMIGTAARAAIEAAFGAAPGAWPWATFGINLVGSFVLGFLLEAISRLGDDTGIRRAIRLGVGTGVIGGFTTYSTFIIEIDQMGRNGVVTLGALYALASISLGVFASLLGLALAARTVHDVSSAKEVVQ